MTVGIGIEEEGGFLSKTLRLNLREFQKHNGRFPRL
jgi:hypothetical protein